MVEDRSSETAGLMQIGGQQSITADDVSFSPVRAQLERGGRWAGG